MLNTLPAELIGLVTSFLEDSHRDLRALCITCSALMPWAQQYLYRELVLDRPLIILRVSSLLVRKPELARHVRSLDLLFLSHFPERHRMATGYMRVVIRALRSMIALKSLMFRSLLPSVDAVALLSTCSFQLRTLFISACDAINFSLLERQHLVEDMSIQDLHDDIITPKYGYPVQNRIPERMIPRLRSLTSSWKVAEQVVSHHPVTDLCVIGTVHVENLLAGLPMISLSTGPLVTLHISIHQDLLGCLSLLANHLPDLVRLSLHMPDADAFHDTDPTAIGCTAAIAFPRFRHLQTLTFGAQRWSELADADVTPFVSRLGETSPTLRLVMLSSVLLPVRDDPAQSFQIIGVHHAKVMEEDGTSSWKRNVERIVIAEGALSVRQRRAGM